MKNSPGYKNGRRLRALERKSAQLDSGNKPTNEGNVPMTQDEIAKLAKEVTILKERMTPIEVAKSSKRKKYRGT